MKETIVSFMGSERLLLASSVVLSWISLQTFLKLSREKDNGHIWICAFSLINALLAVGWEKLQLQQRPVAIIIVPAIILLELYLITRDELLAYLNFFFLFLLYGFSTYSIASVVIDILLKRPWNVESEGYRRVLLSVTFLTTAFIFWMIPRIRVVTVQELSELLHSRSRGKQLCAYSVLTSLILMFSAMFSLNLIYDMSIPHRIHVTIGTDLALKNSLILAGSFMIALFHVWEEKKDRQLMTIDSDLKMERQFRENSQGDAMFRFCFDVSQKEIIEGEYFFRTLEMEFEQDTIQILEDFRMNCIHENDRYYFMPLVDVEQYRAKLEVLPFNSFNVRMSVDYLLNRMNLPENIQEKLYSIGKEWIWIRVQIIVVGEEESGDMLCYFSFNDIDQEITFLEKLQQEAARDALTGVYNRATMEKIMMEMFQKGRSSGTLFIIDMDYFKSVNDTLGHPEGDKALKSVVKIFRESFREKDMIFRLGGDEFCVFAPSLTNVDLICDRAEELNQKGRMTLVSEDGTKEVKTSFSIGIAICREEQALSYEELYHRADLALYEAKGAGRNTYRFWSMALEE